MPAWIKKSASGFEQRSLATDRGRSRFAVGPSEPGLAILSFEPGEWLAPGDPHAVFVVVGGSGRAQLDDEVVELTTWDVLRVTDGVRRAFEAGPDGMHMVALDGHHDSLTGNEHRFSTRRN